VHKEQHNCCNLDSDKNKMFAIFKERDSPMNKREHVIPSRHGMKIFLCRDCFFEKVFFIIKTVQCVIPGRDLGLEPSKHFQKTYLETQNVSKW